MQRRGIGYIFSTEPPASHPFGDFEKRMASPALVTAGSRLSYHFPEEELASLSEQFTLK